MTFYEFNFLSEDKQLELVWDQGTFLLRRKIGRSYLVLFAVYCFFVKIQCDQNHNELTACRSFRSLIPLEPYLESIQISSVHIR